MAIWRHDVSKSQWQAEGLVLTRSWASSFLLITAFTGAESVISTVPERSMEMLEAKAVETSPYGTGSLATSSWIAQTWDTKYTNTREP